MISRAISRRVTAWLSAFIRCCFPRCSPIRRELAGIGSARTRRVDSGGRIARPARDAAAQIYLAPGDEGRLGSSDGGKTQSGRAVERRNGFLRHRPRSRTRRTVSLCCTPATGSGRKGASAGRSMKLRTFTARAKGSWSGSTRSRKSAAPRSPTNALLCPNQAQRSHRTQEFPSLTFRSATRIFFRRRLAGRR